MLRLAAILTLIGLLGGLIAPYAISAVTGAPNPFGGASYLATPTGPNANNSTISVNVGAMWTLAGVAVVGLLFGIVGLFIYRRGFRAFSRVDGQFVSPARWTIAGIIGLVLAIFGLLLLFAGLAQANGCALVTANGSGTSTLTHCGSQLVGDALGALALLVVAVILLLIGGIWLLIGVWRSGTRYNSTILKAAAILYIIPFVNVIAAILVIIETSSIEQRLGGGFPAGPPAYSPPR